MQFRLADKNDKLYISLPNDFVINSYDKELINKNNVEIIRNEKELTLSSSIYEAIKKINPDKGSSLNILFGDTLFDSLPNIKNKNVILIKKN